MDNAQAINNNWSVKIIKCPLSVCVCVNEQKFLWSLMLKTKATNKG